MPYRTFRDSTGVEWSAWDVTPRAMERRIADRRVLAEPTDEERRERQRRLSVGKPAELFSRFAPSWLCFEASRQRRRLMQIPEGWADCPDAELERYLDQARPVPTIALRFATDFLPAK